MIAPPRCHLGSGGAITIEACRRRREGDHPTDPMEILRCRSGFAVAVLRMTKGALSGFAVAALRMTKGVYSGFAAAVLRMTRGRAPASPQRRSG